MSSKDQSKGSVIISCVQLNSNEDKQRNFQLARELIRKAKDEQAKVKNTFMIHDNVIASLLKCKGKSALL